MDDVISRQKAIVAIDKRFESLIKRFGYDSYERADEKTKLVCDGLSEAEDVIMELPSAQPTFDARDTQYNLPIGTDCISRQAATEALFDWEMTYDWDDHCREEDPKPEYIVSPSDVIKKLPSAEPERTPMQELLDVTADRDYWKAQCHSYGMTINRLTESAQPDIVRCKDCKHRDKYGCCKHWKGLAMGDIPIATDDNDFCSNAKRRENG